MNYQVIAQIFQEIKYWPRHWYTKCINGKYGASNNFYVEFSAYYTTDNKADLHLSINQIKLMKSKMRYCKVRGILLYHKPNNVFYPEEYAHHLNYYQCPPLYLNTLLEPGVKMVVNNSKIKFEPCSDLVDETYLVIMLICLTIKIPLVKLKMMKQGRQCIPMMKIQSQAEPLQFQILSQDL